MFFLAIHSAFAADTIKKPNLNVAPQGATGVVGAPAAKPVQEITAEFEEQIVTYFAESNCERVRTALTPSQYREVRPLVIAVVASCEPRGQDPEALFAEAESADPTSDTIWVLHARYRWRKNPASSEELWNKVLLNARTPMMTLLAKQYLSGNGESADDIKIGSEWASFVNLQLGASHETDPLGFAFSDPARNPSMAANLQITGSAQRGTDYGYFGTDYTFTNNRYLSEHNADLLEHDVDFPIGIRVGTREDIVVRPFGSYLNLGDSPYQWLAGFGVMGVAYRSTYKQSVQGSIFEDRYLVGSIQPQEGTHFRFDYSWEFYKPSAYLRFIAFIEHVQAGQDSDAANLFSIPYSHNDLGMQFYVDYDLKWIILSFYPKLTIREDDDTSTYISNDTGLLTYKRREDFQLDLKPSVTIPLGANVQVYAWYEYNRNFSSMGSPDYTDWNILNQTVGVALRAFLVNFF